MSGIARQFQRRIWRTIPSRSMPWWRVTLLAFGIYGPACRWTAIWERRHKARLALALKKTAHFIHETAVPASGKTYHMKPGAQAAPKPIGIGCFERPLPESVPPTERVKAAPGGRDHVAG